MSKSALVISGGGSKGAFAVGVLHEIASITPHLSYDTYVGTSTGSLIIPFAALGEFDLLHKIYTTSTDRDILKKTGLGTALRNKRNYLYHVDPLWELLNKNLPDAKCKKILDDGIELNLLTASLQTKRLTVFSTVDNIQNGDHYDVYHITNPSHLRHAILASACQPVVMPPIKVNKGIAGMAYPEEQFIDGGIVEYAGIEVAINAQADQILTILLSAPGSSRSSDQYTSIIGMLEKTIDIFSSDVNMNDLRIPHLYNDGLQYIDAVKNKLVGLGVGDDVIKKAFNISGQKQNPFIGKTPLDLQYIFPSKKLEGGPGGLNFIPNDMTVMYDQGRMDISAYIADTGWDPGGWV